MFAAGQMVLTESPPKFEQLPAAESPVTTTLVPPDNLHTHKGFITEVYSSQKMVSVHLTNIYKRVPFIAASTNNLIINLSALSF